MKLCRLGTDMSFLASSSNARQHPHSGPTYLLLLHAPTTTVRRMRELRPRWPEVEPPRPRDRCAEMEDRENKAKGASSSSISDVGQIEAGNCPPQLGAGTTSVLPLDLAS
jgi:hypothetical protein